LLFANQWSSISLAEAGLLLSCQPLCASSIYVRDCISCKVNALK
jgi:hypothetical protein